MWVSKMKYDERGREVLDTTPVEVPVKFTRPPSINEMIQRYVRQEIGKAAEAKGEESFEEADDFDVDGDDDAPFSQYQLTMMQEEVKLEPPSEPEVGNGKDKVGAQQGRSADGGRGAGSTNERSGKAGEQGDVAGRGSGPEKAQEGT